MLDFGVYNVRHMVKLLLKHARNMSNAWPKHGQNISKACPKRSQNIAGCCEINIFLAKTLIIIAKSIYSWPKHCLLLRNRHILGQNIVAKSTGRGKTTGKWDRATRCDPCPNGSFSEPGSSQCSLCPAGRTRVSSGSLEEQSNPSAQAQ